MAGSKIVRLLPMFSTVSEIVPTSDSSDPRPVHGKAQGHHQDTHAHHVHHRPESGSRFAAETYNHQLQNLWYVQQFTPTGIKVNPQCQRYMLYIKVLIKVYKGIMEIHISVVLKSY